MASNPGSSVYPSRLDRIASQLDRIESRAAQWDDDPTPTRSRLETRRRGAGAASRKSAPDEGSGNPVRNVRSVWENWWDRVRLQDWDGSIRELAENMARKTKDPFSGRTRQISVLCAFAPFVCSILGAGIRFMPQMPYLSLWQKITYFIAFPIFLAVAGAFVGFLIGVMLDTLERQMEQKELVRGGDRGMGEPSFESPNTRKLTVWIDVDDLEENQRVAETVTGPEGTPILLRHTVLKPSHIQMLKEQGIDRIRVELTTQPHGGDLAFAG